MRFPTGLQNTGEVYANDENPCEQCYNPEPLTPFGRLWGGGVCVGVQRLVLDLFHESVAGGSRQTVCSDDLFKCAGAQQG